MTIQTYTTLDDPKRIVGLFGAGGFAREVMPILRVLCNKNSSSSESINAYFVEYDPHEFEINGYTVVSENAFFFELESAERYFNIAIGDSKIREKVAIECASKNIKPMSIVSPHSVIYDNNDIGAGAILCAHTTITSNTKIGCFFHANIYSYVAHDCVIGDYVTFAPNVHCNGNVHIHDHAYIGTGAVIKQGSPTKPIVIGEGAVVGMGAVVTKNVDPYTIVVGNPARPLVK